MSRSVPHATSGDLVLPARVFIAKDVLHQLVDGQVVLLEMTRQRYFSLDEVGTKVWALLQEKPEIARVCERLLEEYDTTEATLRRDLSALLERLADAGLIRVEA